jgi:hypothetical protein
VSIVKSGISALSKLLILVVFAVVFFVGMVSVVYMSLKGEEVKVPDLVGKTYIDSERELTQLGLKIHRRADRPSPDQPNTVLEQLPKPGETVKTGQQILVVVSTPGPEAEATPTTLKKGDEDDSEKIEEMISEKPKKPKTNTNSNKKKVDTSRDTNENANSDSNSNTNSIPTGEPNDKNKKTGANTSAKPAVPPANKSVVIKPATGEARPRSTPKP